MKYDNYIRNNINLFNPEQGYDLGNMFEDLYDTYKDYKPAQLKANTPKEKLYLQLSRVSFAMHEMNLYLDLHPEDRKIQQLFNDYRKMFIELEKKYEREYGPLTTTSEALEKSPFEWVTEPFPWEENIDV